MSSSSHDPALSNGSDPVLDDVIEEVANRLQAGEVVDGAALLAKYPDRADSIRRLLPAMEVMAGFGVSASRLAASGVPPGLGPLETALGILGDFRIVSEVGRGGMGVVYEAEQLSLVRRVALKVLPFAAAMDPQQLRRFRTEAQAAAQLHHTNIVPVYWIGCEQGVHYYAMQFIEGRTLAQVIRELRQLEGKEPAPGRDRNTGTAGWDPASALTQEFPPPAVDPAEPLPPHERTTAPPSSSSTRNRAYFRNVARLGGEAAAALEHAHQVGIVHRDIKPANLMVDVKGHLWVTDFGLARLQSDSGLTITGDLVGTLRYMSPEQALGQRGYLDHRTDIYSLGVTLYELLTLAPAFGGQDRIALLRRIAEEEPRAPRKLDETIPRDLETIVLKAMAKEPAARYRTAQELADDLGRFLEHKPIRARRPTTWDRALKLCRRHAGLVAAALVMLLLAAAALAAALVRIGHERDLAAASAQAARERAVDLERQLYINRINRAHGEWQGNNLALAEALLENCPPRSRGWEWYFCRELCHLEQLTWQGDGRPIHSLAFSPDGRWILTAANGPDPPERGPGSWTIWDAERGRALASRPLPGAHVVAVHPTGTRVAVGSSAPDGQPGSIAVWDVLPGWPPRLAAEPRLVLRTQPPLVEGLAFSPDGRRIAALSTEEPRGFVELWQLDTGRRELVTEIKSRLRGLAFHPNGTQLAVGGKDGTVHLLDTASGAAHGVLRGHTGEVFTVAYSPDGRCLVSGGWDETVRTWDVASGRPGHVLRGHDSFVRAVAISPEGSRIASASEDNTARLWDAASGKPIGTLRGHRGFVRAVAFSPGGQRLASASDDGSVKLWDSTATGPARTLRHPHWVSRVAYAPDGSTLASASWDGSVLRWDVADGRQLWSRRDTRSRILGLAIRPDGAVIAESDESAQIRLRDSSTGRLLRELRDHRARVYSVAFSPDGRELASISADGTLRVWDAATGESFVFFQTPAGVHPITAIYSPEGRRIAAAVADGTVRILDRSTGRERLRLDCPGLPEQGSSMNGILAFDPTGRRLAAGANFGDKGTAEVRVFDTATGGRLFTLKGHTANITAVAFSPDGRRIASASFDRTVKLWETETGQEVFTLREHTAGVLSVAFSPDGRRLATGSIDYSAKIWDAPGAPRPGTGLDATDDPPSTDRKEGGTPR